MPRRHRWYGQPISPGTPSIPPGSWGEKVKVLVQRAEGEAKNNKKAKCMAVLSVMVKEGVLEAAEHLGHLTGIGTIVNSAKHAAAAASTQEHLDKLNNLNQELLLTAANSRCTCHECHVVLGYAIDQKESKAVRRLAKSMPVPFMSTVIRAGEAMRGGYKKLTKTRGVERKANACRLWVSAKQGCPISQEIVEELCGGGMQKVHDICMSYVGILKLAEKLKST